MNKQIEEEQEMKPGKRVFYIGGGIVIISLLGFLLGVSREINLPKSQEQRSDAHKPFF